MTQAQIDFRFLEKRVFAVVFIFSLSSAIIANLQVLLPYLTFHLSSEFATAALTPLFSALAFLIDPILFFVVLYYYCGGPLLSRIAQVLVSTVFASLIGFWIGGLIVSGVVTFLSSTEEIAANFFFLGFLTSLPSRVVFELLEAFAILAFSDLVPKWKAGLSSLELGQRPLGIVLLSFLYVIFALFNALALPVLAYLSTTMSGLSIVAYAAFVGLLVLGQIVLAMGLYLGKKWAWALGVISSGSALLIDVTVLGVSLWLMIEAPTGFWILAILLLCSLISLTIVAYLLTSKVRKFFGLLNPIESTG